MEEGYRVPKIEEFIKGFEYEVLVSISENKWEERIQTYPAPLKPDEKEYLENEIKVRRVRVVSPVYNDEKIFT